MTPGSITVFTRSRPNPTAEALDRVIDMAVDAGVQVLLPAEEVEKHGLRERDGVVHGAEPGADTDLALVLGGDGTILSSLRLFAGRDVPTFAINYGAIGFLATIEGDRLDEGVRRALAGDFEVRACRPSMPPRCRPAAAVNDISFHRMPNGAWPSSATSSRGRRWSEVRCDGLVISAAGSTGYNLANGGPA